ncbi:TetR family transcriptional regulator [Herbidospora sp. NEAU-GS84]|uniref:TetR family transcriptional regulator n=1 Tax=Herbidospora solisilvae TaxID=2696284 RepID=A0A7C9NN15_9ACTN|nr:TetR family transcriptional regulator [Herbidospora solisilvae]
MNPATSGPSDSPARGAQAVPRRGRPPADVNHIVAVALRLVDEVGAEAFSLRMLATALGSGTATLYRHFAGKDELMVQVVDRVLGEVEITGLEDAPGWQEALTAMATALYETLRRHPQVLPLLIAQVPVGPNALVHRERVLSLLLARGLPVGLAARAFTAVGHYAVGFAVQQLGPTSPGPEDGRHLLEFYRRLDPAMYPATLQAAEALTTIPLDAEFQFGLDLVIGGLERLLPGR